MGGKAAADKKQLKDVLRRGRQRTTRRKVLRWKKDTGRGLKAAAFSLAALGEALPLLEGEDLDKGLEEIDAGLLTALENFRGMRAELAAMLDPPDEEPIDAEFADDPPPDAATTEPANG